MGKAIAAPPGPLCNRTFIIPPRERLTQSIDLLQIEAERGLVFVHPFDDPRVIAGQGTIGLELAEQVPDLDAVLVPVGGGGLIGGVGLALKAIMPAVRVIGVQAEETPAMQAALAAGHRVVVPAASTIADGIAVRRVGEHTFDLARRYVDEVVSVGEEEIANAILLLLEIEKTVVEGAGAVALAALVNGRVALSGKTVVLLLSGGNIDVNVVAQINAQLPGTVDGVHLQAYAGGAGNNPCVGWNFGSVPVWPGLWDLNDSPSQVQTIMSGWNNQCGINGGFMWLYDDFVGNGLAAQYAAAINAAVTGEESFTISGPSNVSITQGSTARALITITPLNGFNGVVTLSLSRLPRGVKARIQGHGTYRQKLLFQATPTATTGSRPVTITGTSGSLTETFDFTLIVNPSTN
jgi:hypothetical protein